MFSFSPFPYLETERLTMRPVTLEDENEIFIFRSHEETLRYIPHTRANSIEDVRKHINNVTALMANNEAVMWGMCLKGTSALIGTIGIFNISAESNTAEIGYVIHPGWQGKGIMHEGVSKVLEYAFNNLKLSAIEATVNPGNARSISLLKRNGFTYTRDMENEYIYSCYKVIE